MRVLFPTVKLNPEQENKKHQPWGMSAQMQTQGTTSGASWSLGLGDWLAS